MDLRRNLTPAVLSYEGIQYRCMAPGVMETAHLNYLREHLRILSGFYGCRTAFSCSVCSRNGGRPSTAKLSVSTIIFLAGAMIMRMICWIPWPLTRTAALAWRPT